MILYMYTIVRIFAKESSEELRIIANKIPFKTEQFDLSKPAGELATDLMIALHKVLVLVDTRWNHHMHRT
jgi:hypothetical protein